MGREVGGGFRMGNTCIPVVDSFWYLAKLIQFVKFRNKIKLKKKKDTSRLREFHQKKKYIYIYCYCMYSCLGDIYNLFHRNFFFFFNWRIIALQNFDVFYQTSTWISHQFSSIQYLSHVQLFATPWIIAHQASLSFTSSRNSFKLMSIESVMPSSHLILCYSLLLLPPIPPSIRVFSSESTLCMKWPKYWSFSFSISPSNEHPGLISFRMDWLDLLAVQRTLKSLLQHHSSKASILWHSAFSTVQLSHPYMTTGKTIALKRWNFVCNVSAFEYAV